MYQENVLRFVTLGSRISRDEVLQKRDLILPSLVAVWLLWMGWGLSGYWVYLAWAMFLLYVAIVVATFVMCWCGLTLKIGWWLSVIRGGGLSLQLCIASIMTFSAWTGFTPLYFLFFLPMVFTPILIAILVYRRLKKPNYNPQDGTSNDVKIKFSVVGVLSVTIWRVLYRVNPSLFFIVAIVGFALFIAMFSISWVILLKLYYIKKYNISL